MIHRLFFLPGTGADPEFWRPLGNLLPDHWEKRYFGWPGIGHQPPDPKVTGFNDLVRIVEESLENTPVDLLAQSMGGVVAMRVALNNPLKIRRIILAATSGGIDVSSLGAADWRPSYKEEYPEAPPWITEERPRYDDEIDKIVHPTLLLWGDNDPISPVQVGKRLSDILPNASLHVLPNGNHSFVNERPSEIAELIRSHLA